MHGEIVPLVSNHTFQYRGDTDCSITTSQYLSKQAMHFKSGGY